jgi:hypothetical protein
MMLVELSGLPGVVSGEVSLAIVCSISRSCSGRARPC